ncbi:MAG: tetraacyldisaccharide 4'-kinase [Legionellales bacterium]|nr:tetraacyldisaccharide 4'-kinase [Legionellales bacterium]
MQSFISYSIRMRFFPRRQTIEALILRQWFVSLSWAYMLVALPASWLYRCAHGLHKCYQINHCDKLPSAPKVCAVGNLIAGGVGKTPFVIHLCKQLTQVNLKVAIICRNLSSSPANHPICVASHHTAVTVGDEARLIADQTDAIVVCSKKKYLAYQWVLRHKSVDVILIDDGLQHYRIPRHLEILLVDERLYGNQYCLPLGPLREPVSRQQRVDYKLTREIDFTIQDDFSRLYNLKSQTIIDPADRQCYNWCVLTAIANPARFQQAISEWLRQPVTVYAYPDHADFSAVNWHELNQFQLIMTEKDAVKCPVDHDNIWVVPQHVSIHKQTLNGIIGQLS